VTLAASGGLCFAPLRIETNLTGLFQFVLQVLPYSIAASTLLKIVHDIMEKSKCPCLNQSSMFSYSPKEDRHAHQKSKISLNRPFSLLLYNLFHSPRAYIFNGAQRSVFPSCHKKFDIAKFHSSNREASRLISRAAAIQSMEHDNLSGNSVHSLERVAAITPQDNALSDMLSDKPAQNMQRCAIC